MRSSGRRKLEMAERVLSFNRAHPPTDPGTAILFDQLEASIKQAVDLIKLQAESRSRSTAGTGRRQKARQRLSSGLLRMVARAGQAAAKEDPTLGPVFATVPSRVRGLGFIAAAENLLAAGRTHLEALSTHGVTEALLGEADAMLAKVSAATVEANANHQAWIEAGAQLLIVTAKVMELVEVIDGLNRHRFADNPEVLRAWESARNILNAPRPADPSTGPQVPPGPEGEGLNAAA